jgi:hypothetical protein
MSSLLCSHEKTWTVFNRKGVVLGQVSVLGGFEVLEMGTDYVLGRWLDDVERCTRVNRWSPWHAVCLASPGNLNDGDVLHSLRSDV